MTRLSSLRPESSQPSLQHKPNTFACQLPESGFVLDKSFGNDYIVLFNVTLGKVF